MRVEMNRLENAARMAMAHQPAYVDLPVPASRRIGALAIGMAALALAALYALLA